MKKVFVIIGIIFSLSFLYGKDFKFEIKPIYTLQNGVLNEFVLYNDSQKQQQKLSELNWNIVNSNNLGAELRFVYKFLDFSCYIGGGIPSVSGLMYDSDWQNFSDVTMKTNYSISTNIIDSNFDCKFKFSGNIKPLRWLTVSPFIDYSYNCIYFESRDAEGWYGDSDSMWKFTGNSINISWNDENAIHFKPGTQRTLNSIDYYRMTHNIYLGVNLLFDIFSKLSVYTSISAAPLNYVESVDTHWNDSKKASGTMYNDRMLGAFNFYTANIGMDFSPKSFFTIGLNCEFTYIHFFVGKTYRKTTNTMNYPDSPLASSYAGCSGYLINASIYASFRL